MAQVGKSTESYGVYDAFAITPDDNTDLVGGPTRGIYVGVTGNLACVMSGGTTVTMTGLAAGVWHPIQAQRILSTGTTATSILGGR